MATNDATMNIIIWIHVFYAPPSVKRGILSYPCPSVPSVRTSVRPSEICYPQLLINYPLDCYETWLDCSLGWEYVH